MLDTQSTKIYLDWAATAPLSSEAAEAMKPFLIPGCENLDYGANANSLHSSGRRAFACLEEARLSLARDLKASRPDEIIFTSGATEANNAALGGIVAAARKRAIQKGLKDFVPHIIVSEIEHDAVLAPAKTLASQGCEVSYLSPTRQGFIEVSTLEKALQENTVLVSIQHANNEIGSVQALAELTSLAHDAGALMHTDAVQALGKVTIDLASLGVDAASFSAHKIGGPKGVGCLYLKSGTAFKPLMQGGGQEFGKRSGTQNVCGAVGFAAACKAACVQQEEESRRLCALRDELYARLIALPHVYPSIDIPPQSIKHLPTIIPVCVDGLESETMILRLDMRGFEVSGGSACSVHSLEPSHVLKALNIPVNRALGSLRVSLGAYTEQKDILAFAEAFERCISER